MTYPATFSEAIPFLNASIQSSMPGQLVEAMIGLFASNPDFANAIIPTYAKYLKGQDFEILAGRFPALSPLLNGYRQVLEAQVS